MPQERIAAKNAQVKNRNRFHCSGGPFRGHSSSCGEGPIQGVGTHMFTKGLERPLEHSVVKKSSLKCVLSNYPGVCVCVSVCLCVCVHACMSFTVCEYIVIDPLSLVFFMGEGGCSVLATNHSKATNSVQ